MRINPFYLHGEELTPVRKLLALHALAGGAPLSEYTETGNPVSFETNVAKPLSVLAAFTPVQAGSGDPSPENVRPITGWSGVKVWRTGKNVADIIGFTAQDVNGIDASTFALSNSYGTTISTKDFTSPDTALVVTQSSYTTDYAKENYRNGYFDIVPSNLEFGKNYSISFKVTNIVSNPLEASLSDLVLIRPSGNATSSPIVSGEYVTFTFTYSQNAGSPGRRIIGIRNCGMSFTVSEILITVSDETNREFVPYTGESVSVTFPALGKNLIYPTPYGGQFFNVPVGTDFAKTTTKATYEQSGNTITVTTDGQWYGMIFATDMLPPGTYNIHTEPGDVHCRLSTYVTGNDFIALARYAMTTNNKSVTLEQSARIVVTISNDNAEGGAVTCTNLQVESGNSYTAWEAFDNTAYGGTLDLSTGVLTVEWYGNSYKWSEGTNESSVGETLKKRRFSLPLIPKTGSANNICNVAPYNSGAAESTKFNVSVTGNNAYAYVTLPNDTDEDTEIQIVSVLVDPLVYQLTPTEILSLVGDNVLWSDLNGDLTVAYKKKG